MIPGIVDSAVSALRAFTDEFVTAGVFHPRWSATRGTWIAKAGDTEATSAVSGYPILSFNANSAEVSLQTSQVTSNKFGWGLSFWIVDANNWWGLLADRTTYTGIIGYTTAYPCGGGQCGGGCASCPCTVCDGPGCTGNCTFVAYPTATTVPVYGTRYLYTIKLIRSVSGSVSTISTATVADDNVSTSTIGYVQIVTNGAGQITATGQMSYGGPVAQIQTTPVSPNKGKRHGLLVGPATTGTQATTLERMIYAPA